MSWTLQITRSARRALLRLSNRDKEAFQKAFNEICLDPGSVDMIKLQGYKKQWRLRVGRWRAILRMENRTGTIWVLRILPRKEAYRD